MEPVLVSEHRIEWLTTKFEKLVRRAERLKLTPPKLVRGGDQLWPLVVAKNKNIYTTKPSLIKPEDLNDNKHNVVGYERFSFFHVEGEAPTIPGWDLVAVIEHTTDSEIGNVVRTVPDKECPVDFRRASSVCDHCGVFRRRLETFVLVNEQKEYKQVGRNCLADFCRDPEAAENLTKAAAILFSANELLGACVVDDEDMYSGNRQPSLFGIENLLITTAVVIRKCGWVSKSQAMKAPEWDRPTPTATIVSRVMCEFMPPDEIKKLREEPVTEEDVKNVEEALEWIRAKRDEADRLGDYLYNLLVVCSQDAVPGKHFGLACSLVSTYLREVERLKVQQYEKRKPSEHFGVVGKRDVFELKLLSVTEGEGYMAGTVNYRHKFADANGNIAVWWASSDSDFEVDQTYKVKATVKKHDEYNGKKQTILTRVALHVEKEKKCRRKKVSTGATGTAEGECQSSSA